MAEIPTNIQCREGVLYEYFQIVTSTWEKENMQLVRVPKNTLFLGLNRTKPVKYLTPSL